MAKTECMGLFVFGEAFLLFVIHIDCEVEEDDNSAP